jgi:hypothetical protein
MNSGLLCATAHCGARSVIAAIKAKRHTILAVGISLSIADAEILAGRMLERKGGSRLLLCAHAKHIIMSSRPKRRDDIGGAASSQGW